MKELIEKVAKAMPKATFEEQIGAIASEAQEAGFWDFISKEAVRLAPQEKTAGTVKKVGEATVRFDKMTMGDVVNYLASQYGGTPAEEDKTASEKKTARQRFDDMVKAALARPT